jgi:SAM-dependent methyltransferase
MAKRMTREKIFRFWRGQAEIHGQSHAASWSDRYAVELEIEQLARRIEDGDRVLDIGCANGYSTLRLASRRRIDIRGVDYAPEMIDQAREALRSANAQGAKIEFAVDDVTDLSEPSDRYDKVTVTRVIINLGEWDQQVRGLRESLRVVRPGGLLLVSEACLQGWNSLNRIRAEWGLDPIPMPPFNNYLDQERVIDALAPEARLLELSNFSSTYYVGTRVLKPLLAKAVDAGVDVADPDMDWNRWFAMLPAAGDYGVQSLFVFEKRA